MPLTYLDLTEAEIEAFGAQKQRRIHARRARAWKHMAREERDAGAGPPKPQAMAARRPRYRRRERRKAEEPHPYADPNRPIPNLAAADRFECYYWAQNLVSTPQEWVKMIGTLHRALPTTFRVSTNPALAATVAECLSHKDIAAVLAAARPLPHLSSWQLDGVSKEELKTSYAPEHVALQAWLSKYSALGVVTRQAIESMVPVALLQPQPHHRMLDMCASPGSLTMALLTMALLTMALLTMALLTMACTWSHAPGYRRLQPPLPTIAGAPRLVPRRHRRSRPSRPKAAAVAAAAVTWWPTTWCPPAARCCCAGARRWAS
jgi:hypothetical protein